MGKVLLACRLAVRDMGRRRAEAVMLLLAIVAATSTLTLGLLVHGGTSPTYGLSAAQLLPALLGALLAIPGGIGIYEAASNG